MTPDERIVSNIYKHSGPESERKEAREESEQIFKGNKVLLNSD